MLPRTVRGVVEAAAVVVEEVGKRVVGTAATILERTGVDVAEVERRLGGQFPPSAKQLQTLAEEAVTAGRAGVDLAVGVARGEVEKAFERVGDQVTKVGVVLAYLESKLREVEEDAVPAARPAAGARDEEPVPAPRADGLFGRGWEQRDEPPVGRAVGEPVAAERVEVDEPVEVDPPVAPVREAPAGPSGSEPVEKAVAKKAAAETTAAEKTAAKKTAAKKTAAKATTAKTPAVKKTAVKKTATAKSTARKTAAADVPAKRTATKKTTVRKATSTKKPDA
ncbi:hypothetical protein PUR71_01675 [Streptomyces sp. SP17BM10]|uniref:hypothetical protein n=1 Tax=Streptomyces sp. SP17BM10 TaxID=3002530 RepID=UPI002E77668F|nr:hypothetical protein [Streptomyces sp. SP17BM10]MEE1781650.1 hypothetical protein [Streptomyces sp. SP17BM10]